MQEITVSLFTDVTYKQPYIKHFSWFSQNQFLYPGLHKTECPQENMCIWKQNTVPNFEFYHQKKKKAKK